MKYLSHESIHAEAFLKRENPSLGVGASVSFFGIVRDENKGRKVTHLVYEAYESLAEAMIEELLGKATRIWPILDAKILHRLGSVDAGQIAVAIGVVSAHRDEAYLASRFLIDEVKSKVPVWKKEYFEDGIYHWGSCENHGQSFYRSLQDVKILPRERKDIKISIPEKYQGAGCELKSLSEKRF